MCARFSVVVLLLLTVSISSPVARGQGQPRGQAPRLMTLRTEATIEAVRAGVLLVATEKGDKWAITTPRTVEAIEFHGEASSNWLQRGMSVRFHTLLDKRFRAQENVRGISVITLRQGVMPGIFPDQETPGKNESFTTPKVPAARKRASRTVPTTRCLVIGRLLGVKKGNLMVAAGRRVVEAPLAENAEVTVDVNDYRLARNGDKVEVEARYMPQRPGQAQGERLVITAAKPLGEVPQVTNGRGKKKDKPETGDPDRAKGKSARKS